MRDYVRNESPTPDVLYGEYRGPNELRTTGTVWTARSERLRDIASGMGSGKWYHRPEGGAMGEDGELIELVRKTRE